MVLLKTVSFQQLKVNENSIFSSHSIDLWIFMIDCSKLLTWLEFSWNNQPSETFLMMTHICLIQVEYWNIQFLLINFVPLTSSLSKMTFHETLKCYHTQPLAMLLTTGKLCAAFQKKVVKVLSGSEDAELRTVCIVKILVFWFSHAQ